MSDYQAIFTAPCAALGIRIEQARLAGIDFLPPETTALAPQGSLEQASLAQQVCDQLAAYFADPSFVFNLPLASNGTPFRRRVWQALCEIPPGQTTTYGELAQQLGSAPRAVGQACGANPVPIVVPCHRVVAKNGLGGFMNYSGGEPLAIKRWLLRHEQADSNSSGHQRPA